MSLVDCVFVVGVGEAPQRVAAPAASAASSSSVSPRSDDESDAERWQDIGITEPLHRPPDEDDFRTAEYMPVIVDGLKFPPDYADSVIADTPTFCFPAGLHLAREPRSPTFAAFVLTDVSGARRYVATLVSYVATSAQRFGSTATETVYAPTALCLVSALPLVATFRRALAFLARTSAPEAFISHLVCDLPAPPRGAVAVEFALGPERFRLALPPPRGLPECQISLDYLFQALHVEDILRLVSCALLEQKIMFVSRHQTLLFVATELLVSLMHPFEWPHTLIAVLPCSLLDAVCAPVPFIVGMLAQFRDQVSEELDGVVVVDLDRGHLTLPTPLSITLARVSPTDDAAPEPGAMIDYLPPLPEVPGADLLDTLVALSRPAFDELSSIPDADEAAAARRAGVPTDSLAPAGRVRFPDSQVRRAFASFFARLFDKVGSFFAFGNRVFSVNDFLRNWPAPDRIFLRAFFETQMFIRFVEDQDAALINVEVPSAPPPAIALAVEMPPRAGVPSAPDCPRTVFTSWDPALLRQARSVDDIIARLGALIQEHPEVAQLRMMRANLHYSCAQFLEALHDFDSAAALEPTLVPDALLRSIVRHHFDSDQLTALQNEDRVSRRLSGIVKRQLRKFTVTESRDGPPGLIVANLGTTGHVPLLEELGLISDGMVLRDNFTAYACEPNTGLAEDAETACRLFDGIADVALGQQQSLALEQLTRYFEALDTAQRRRMDDGFRLRDGELLIRVSSKAYRHLTSGAGHLILTSHRLLFGTTEAGFATVLEPLSLLEACQGFAYKVVIPPGLPCLRIFRKDDGPIEFGFWSISERDLWRLYLNQVAAGNYLDSEAHPEVDLLQMSPGLRPRALGGFQAQAINNLVRSEALALLHGKRVDLLLHMHLEIAAQQSDFSKVIRSQRESRGFTVLNSRQHAPGGGDGASDQEPPTQIVADMLRSWLSFFYRQVAHLADDSGAALRHGFPESDEFRRLIAQTGRLRNLDLSRLGRAETIALFINLYNLMVVHVYAVMGLPSAMEKMVYYTCARYDVGGSLFSLDDIKHGVLRGNALRRRKFIMSLEMRQFEQGDPRLRYAVTPTDARISMCLSKHSHQSPSVRIYVAKDLETQLQAAAREFCEQCVRVNAQAARVTLPKLFEALQLDFGANERKALSWVASFLPQESGRDLKRLLAADRPFKVVYDHDTSFEPKPFHQ